MKLTWASLTDKTRNKFLQIEVSSTVQELKCAIEEQCGTQSCEQDLIYAGRRFENERNTS